jgi:hypothetical protein
MEQPDFSHLICNSRLYRGLYSFFTPVLDLYRIKPIPPSAACQKGRRASGTPYAIPIISKLQRFFASANRDF